MRVTVEVDMDDVSGLDQEAVVKRRLEFIFAYALGFVSTCIVKPGRMEEHATGEFFGLAYNVKVTIDKRVL